MAAPATGGTAHLVARADSGLRYEWPEILPGGRALLLSVVGPSRLDLAALTLATGRVTRFSQRGGYPRYVNAGFVVVSDPSGILSAVPFDPRHLQVTGAAVPIVDKLSSNPDGDVNVGVSRSGGLAYQASVSSGNRLVLVERSGGVQEIGSDTAFYYGPRFSPDGRRVAVARYGDIQNLSNPDVWVLDLEQHTRTRLTFDTTASWPVWTPDGRRVAYRRARAGAGGVFWIPADGSGAPESLMTSAGNWFPTGFTPDGRGLVYHGVAPQGSMAEIGTSSVTGDRSGHQLLASAFHNYDPSVSPDGRWIAYMSNESGRMEVYVRPFPGPGGRWQVSLDGGAEPVWSPTGREIFYRDGERMMAAAVREQGAFEVLSRTQLFSGPYNVTNNVLTNYDVSRDGQRFLMVLPVEGAEQSVYVTLNWFDQLRRQRAAH